ncbi:MAG: polysaccharide deacetylase family protein, partial [Armatimonadota bacterium]
MRAACVALVLASPGVGGGADDDASKPRVSTSAEAEYAPPVGLWTPSGFFPVAVAPVDWSVPRGYRGTLIRKRPRRFPAKLVALTFDDGPDRKITPRILEALATHGARATFFVLGERVRRHAGLLRRMATRGHAVGNHSFSHPARPSAEEAEEELHKTEQLIRGATGRPPRCFRPPYGITD